MEQKCGYDLYLQLAHALFPKYKYDKKIHFFAISCPNPMLTRPQEILSSPHCWDVFQDLKNITDKI